MLPNRRRRAHNPNLGSEASTSPNQNPSDPIVASAQLPYEPLLEFDRVPEHFSWQGTDAEGPGVKDQAVCGSCWAFGTTGTLQGAYFLATGEEDSEGIHRS